MIQTHTPTRFLCATTTFMADTNAVRVPGMYPFFIVIIVPHIQSHSNTFRFVDLTVSKQNPR